MESGAGGSVALMKNTICRNIFLALFYLAFNHNTFIYLLSTGVLIVGGALSLQLNAPANAAKKQERKPVNQNYESPFICCVTSCFVFGVYLIPEQPMASYSYFCYMF